MKGFEQLDRQTAEPAAEEILSLTEYEEMQIKEALSRENKELARRKLGHSPSDEEAVMFYADKGGPEEFRKRYGHLLQGRHESRKKKGSWAA